MIVTLLIGVATICVYLTNFYDKQYGIIDEEPKPIMTYKFLLFSKDSCGPCGLVDRYMKSINDERTSVLEKVLLEDVSDEPIPEENLALAKKYGVTATPVLVIVDSEGELKETYVGGVPITQNIRKLFDKYL